MDPQYIYDEDSSEEVGIDLHDRSLDYHKDFLRCLEPSVVNVICR